MATRLFVGSLNRTTSAIVLGHLFETIGAVKTAEIITGEDKNVSLGFGFVTMETPELAEEAIKQLNGTVLEDSTIRVTYARDDSQNQRGGFRGRRGRSFRGSYQAPYGADFAPRRPYRGRGYGGYNYYGGYGDYGYSGYYDYPRYGRPSRGRYGYQPYPYSYSYGQSARGGRGRRGRRHDPSAPKSATQIHIGNLPFHLKKEELAEALHDFKVKEIILSPDVFNTTRNRGYAFVEFETPEESQRILEHFHTITIQGRECTISPAFERPVKEQHEDAAAPVAEHPTD